MQSLEKSLNISHLNATPARVLGTHCSLSSAPQPLPCCRSPSLDLSGSKPGISLECPQNRCAGVLSALAARCTTATDQVLCLAANPPLQDTCPKWTSTVNSEGNFNAKAIRLVLFLLFHVAPPFLCSENIK